MVLANVSDGTLSHLEQLGRALAPIYRDTRLPDGRIGELDLRFVSTRSTRGG